MADDNALGTAPTRRAWLGPWKLDVDGWWRGYEYFISGWDGEYRQIGMRVLDPMTGVARDIT